MTNFRILFLPLPFTLYLLTSHEEREEFRTCQVVWENVKLPDLIASEICDEVHYGHKLKEKTSNFYFVIEN